MRGIKEQVLKKAIEFIADDKTVLAFVLIDEGNFKKPDILWTNLKILIDERGICLFCLEKCKGNGVIKCKNFKFNKDFVFSYFKEMI